MTPRKGVSPGLDIAITTQPEPSGLESARTTQAPVPVGGQMKVSVDYSDFAAASGGDWASRLRFVDVTDERNTVLETDVSLADRTAEVTVPAKSLQTGTVQLALVAGASGSTGDYSATSLSASASWMVGRQTGDFTWSYPFDLPSAVNGPMPQFGLNYSSGSVDGRTAASNNQTSYIGEGFSGEVGYVERKFVSCADDMGGSNASQKTSDQCWRDDNASLVLGGRSTELVKDSSGNWHLKDADGSTIERRTTGHNADNNNEYWVLTTPDGTRYHFGREKWAAGDEKDTDSTLVAPVFGNQAGEPCHASAFTDSDCTQAYRWNVDFVVDAHDNLLTYFYAREGNRYGSRKGAEALDYDRAGRLVSIEYGGRLSTRADKSPSRVLLSYAQRCLSTSSFNCESEPLNSANAQHWPDVPFDQVCTSGTCGDGNHAPSFFSRLRLSRITSQVLKGTTHTDVDRYDLTHTFPPATDGTGASLTLQKIVHTGLGEKNIVLDPVVLTYALMPNRVSGFPDNQDAPPLMKSRLSSVDSESGSRISVEYTAAECSASNVPTQANLDSNAKRCFPVWWMEPGSFAQNLHFFHKYLAKTVTQSDLGGGQPDVATRYEYVGNPAWHYDDAELTREKYRTWSDWRGYAHVRETTGAGVSTLFKEFRYMRGMHGDRTSTPGTTKSVSLTGLRAPALTDHNRFNGVVREETVRLASASGAEVTTTVNTPWLGPVIATGGGDVARLVKNQSTQVFTPIAAGGVRQTKSVTTYDADGLPTRLDDLGDVATATDDLCTKTEYVKGNGILDKLSKVTVTSKTCSAAVTASDLVSETTHAYDGQAMGVAPTKGDVTRTAVRAENGVVTKSVMTYDALGRVLTTTDAGGNVESVEYSPATGHPDVVTTYEPAPNGSTAPADRWKSIQYLNRERGLPDAEVDLNGKRIDYAYNALGQVTSVWSTAGSKASDAPASVKFDYRVKADGRNVVTTQQLRNDNTYLTSYMFYDGLLRPRQYQAPATGTQGGRLITDTEYNSAGLETAIKGPYFNSAAASATLVSAPGDNTIPRVEATQYDGAGRVVRNDFKSYSTVQWYTSTTYGGDRITVNPPGKEPLTVSVLDGRDRVKEKIEYLVDSPTGAASEIGARTLYDYHPDGKVKRVRDGADLTSTPNIDESNEWVYTYDLRGRLIASSDPDSGETRNTYDDQDRLVSSTRAGRTVSSEYDRAGRRTKMSEGSTTMATWTYDTLAGAKGQLASATRYAKDPSGTMAPYTTAVTGYDAAYRPLGSSVIIPAGETGLAGTYTTSMTYNRDGTVATTSLPRIGPATSPAMAAETLIYKYDGFGQLDTLVGRSPYVVDTEYSEFGEVSVRTLGTTLSKAVFDWRVYAADTGRLSMNWVQREGANNADRLTGYTYDPAGNVTKISDDALGESQCFDYDQMGQMTRAWTQASTSDACAWNATAGTGPSPYRVAWTYDNPTGNRLTETRYDGNVISATDAYTYPAPVENTVQPHTPTTISTDSASGEHTERYLEYSAGSRVVDFDWFGGRIQGNVWTADGLLESYDGWGEMDGSFVYDAAGNRLIKRESGNSTLELGHTEVLVPAAGAASATRFYSAGGENVALRTASTIRFVVADPQGTSQLQIEHSNQTVSTRRTLPFGQTRPVNATGGNWTGNRGFVGGTIDSSTTHLGAREYDSRLGMFISDDPLVDHGDSRQMQGFAYARSNPLAFSDASGLFPTKHDGPGNHPTNLPIPDSPGGGTRQSPSEPKPPVPAPVQQAAQEVVAAQTAEKAVRAKLIATAKELGKIVLDELGVTAGLDCIQNGSAGSCASTALNVLTTVGAGFAVKIIAKYGAPWKWKKAADLAGRVTNLVGELISGVGEWRKAGKRVEAVTDNLGVGAGTIDDAGQLVYRIHGNDARKWGHSWTTENPLKMANPRSRLGLPKVNSGEHVTCARVCDMGGVKKRDALPLDGNPGGGPEWLFPNPQQQLNEIWTLRMDPPL
ncbi:RHS repeat domain-containing protein [Nocardioides jishulii]|uniref:Sugar-binding protein n=1 Tax=Nocardioides jishulii TaxID=2575440 RepID=A0A4V5TKW8_9ACTN|nr:RHS repeat-associated core domain-containing protein [Nocardioides jishulii]TKI63923.1 hypothetical protein FC770_01710 [Nocardioides jishulii]